MTPQNRRLAANQYPVIRLQVSAMSFADLALAPVLLENLQRHYGEERYRPCSLLRQRALLESSYES